MKYTSRGLRRRGDADKREVILTHKDPMTGESLTTYHTVTAKTKRAAGRAREELIVQLDISYLDGSLPAQFRTRYDYDFLYMLVNHIQTLRYMAKKGGRIVCHTVLKEVVLHVICEYAQFVFDLAEYVPAEEADPMETFAEIAGDCDIDMWLFCRDSLVAPGDNYYFDCWNEPQFFLEPPIEK